MKKSSHKQKTQEKKWRMPYRQANTATLCALDRTAEGRAAMSIRVALGNPYAKYSPTWGACQHRSGQFSSCAGIYIFFQVSGHYQTAQWAKAWAGELNLSLFITVLCVRTGDCKQPEYSPAPVRASGKSLFWLGGSLNQPSCAKGCISLYRNSSNFYSWAEKKYARNKILPFVDAPDKEKYLSSSASSFIKWFSQFGEVEKFFPFMESSLQPWSICLSWGDTWTSLSRGQKKPPNTLVHFLKIL